MNYQNVSVFRKGIFNKRFIAVTLLFCMLFSIVFQFWEEASASLQRANEFIMVSNENQFANAIITITDGGIIALKNDIDLNFFTAEPNKNITITTFPSDMQYTITTKQKDQRHFLLKENDFNNKTIRFSNIILDGDGVGGGIDCYAENAIIENVVIENCMAEIGGAISINNKNINQDPYNIDIIRAQFKNNKANKDGGAIYISGPGIVNITNTQIYNSESNNGGGIYLKDKVTLNIKEKSIISNNKSIKDGGGIYTPYKEIENINIDDTSIFYNNISEKSYGMAETDKSKHDSHIKTLLYTSPHKNAYNNNDISYKSYKVEFIDSSNNNEIIKTTYINENGDYIIQPSDPIKLLSEFNGWYTNNTFNEKVDFTKKIESDKQYYAKWTNNGGKLTIKWVGKTGLDSTTELYKEEYTKEDGDQYSIDVNNYSNFTMDSRWDYIGWELKDINDTILNKDTTSNITVDYKKDTEQILTLYFEEKTSRIEVKGIFKDKNGVEKELYSYNKYEHKDNGKIEIEAWDTPLYKVSGYEKDGIITTGSVSKVEIDPIDGNQTIKFIYEDNTIDVTIKAYYGDGTTNTTNKIDSFTEYTVKAEVGKPFIYNTAPQITGYTNKDVLPASGEIATVNNSNNEIIFYYIKDTGNLNIIAMEVDDQGDVGVIATYNENVQNIGPNTINAPSNVDSNIFELQGSSSKTVQYDGINNPQDIEFKYKRKTRKVVVKAIDIDTKQEITSEINDYQVGKVYDISQPPVATGYTLVGDSTQTVLVDGSSINDIEIKFLYRKNEKGTIKVIAYWYDGTNENIIQSYTQKSQVGMAVEVDAPQFKGWKLAAGEATQQTVTATSGSQEVKFRYEKDIYTIKVKLTSNGTDITQNAPNDYKTSIEVPKDDEYTVTAPQLSGYILEPTEKQVIKVDNSIADSNDECLVEFKYKKLDEVIKEGYVKLQIKGTDGTKEIYSYELLVRKDEETEIKASEVSMYKLDETRAENYPTGDKVNEQLGSRKIDSSIYDKHTFYYNKNTANVEIEVIDDGTNQPIAGEIIQPVTGIIKETINVNAPIIADYELIQGEASMKSHIIEGDATKDKITFRYKKIDGNVVFQYVTDDGSIIAQQSEKRQIGITTTGLQPTSPIVLPLGWELKNGTGSPTANEPTVKANTIITYKVDKKLEKIKINYYEKGTTNKVATQTENTRQIGTTVQVIAEPTDLKAGYVLVGAPYETITVGISNEVNFYYEDRTKAGAGSVTVIARDKVTKEIINYQTEPAIKVGESYQTTAPNIMGWKNANWVSTSDEEAGQMSVVGVIVIYEYEEDTVEVEIHITDENGSELENIAYITGTTYEVRKERKGKDVIITAPHIDGYQIVSQGIEKINNIQQDDKVTFEYKKLDDIIKEGYVKLQIKGSDGTKEIYSYELLVRKDEETEVKASEVSMYKLDETRAENYPTGNIGGEQLGSKKINISTDGTHTFYYNKNTAIVEIEVIDDTNQPITGINIQPVTGIKGETINVNAPIITDYELIQGEDFTKSHEIKGDTTQDKITFRYKKIDGNVIFQYVTDDGNIILQTSETKPVGTSTNGLQPSSPINLPEGWVLKDGTGNPTASESTVGSKTTIKYELEKQISKIKINYYEKDTTNKVATQTEITRQIGTTVQVIAEPTDLKAGYVLVGAPYETITVGISNEVNFYYEDRTKAGAGSVTIIARDKVTKEIINYQTEPAIKVGESYQTTAPSIMGWKNANWVSTSDKEAGQMSVVGVIVIYEYEEDTVEVEIHITDENGSELENVAYITGTTYEVRKERKGKDVIITAPHIDGYQIVSQGIEKINNIQQDDKVTFEYKKLDDIIKEGYVKLQIKGSDGTNEIYSYETLVRKDEETDILAPHINMYQLDDTNSENYPTGDMTKEQPGSRKINISKDGEHIFYYKKDISEVQIEVIDSETNQPISGINIQPVTGIKGETINVNAPTITDYQLIQTESVSKSHEIKGDKAQDIITFIYKKMDGNVIFQYVTNEGNIILQTSESRQVGISTNGLEPTTQVVLPLGWELKNGTGNPSANEKTVQSNTIITYEVEMRLSKIKVNYYQIGTSKKVASQTFVEKQLGSSAQVVAMPTDLQPGYILVGAPYKTITVTANEEVDFYYEDRTKAGAGSVIIIAKDKDTKEIISYQANSPIKIDEEYETKAPKIKGWKNPTWVATSDEQTGKMSIAGVIVIYEYERETVELEIHLTDQNGLPLENISYMSGTKYQVTKEQLGKDITINAPHLNGYQVIGSGVTTINNIQKNEKVFFKYQKSTLDNKVLVQCVDNTKISPNNVITSWIEQGTIGEVFTISSPNIPNYKLLDTEANKKSGKFGEEEIVVFKYEPLTTDVTIHATDESGNDIPGYVPKVTTNVAFNTEYKTIAPIIKGYEVADGEFEKTILSVDEKNNSITFIYKKSEGNIIIKAVEVNNESNIIGIWTDKKEVGDIYTADEKEFEGWVSQGVVPITVNEGQNEVIIKYEKDLANIEIFAISDNDGTILHSEIVNNIQIGTQYTKAMLYIEGYKLIDNDTSSKTINVAKVNNKIEFRYEKTNANVVIIHKDKESKEILSMTMEEKLSGENFTANSIDLKGYKVFGDNTKVYTVPNSGVLTIEFEYEKYMGKITVNLIDIKDNSIIDTFVENIQYERDSVIYAPQLGGYVLEDDSYKNVKISEGEEKVISFRYRNIEDVVSEKYVNIIIVGKSSNNMLYSYERRFEKSNTPIELEYETDIFYVPGYKLKEGQNTEVIPDGKTLKVEFEYIKNQSNVKISAVYNESPYDKPIENFVPIYINAEIGKEFEFIAPAIPGFNHVGGTDNPILVEQGQNEIKFYYERSEGNLTVIAKEGNTIIGQVTRKVDKGTAIDTSNLNRPTLNEIPALEYYNSTDEIGISSHEVYDGINNVTLVYQYKTKTSEVKIIAKDILTKEELGNISVGQKKILEDYNIENDVKDLDKLVENLNKSYTRITSQTKIYVLVNEKDNEIIIWYMPERDGMVPVELRVGSRNGQLLQSYFIKATENEVVVATENQIPNLSGMGYRFNGTESIITATEGTSEKIILVYDDIRAKINIYISRDGSTPYLHKVENVLIGSDIDVYAPYLRGYVLNGFNKDNTGDVNIDNSFVNVGFSTILTDHNLVFYYQNMEEYIQQEYVNILVKGVNKLGQELYSHIVTLEKADREIGIEAFEVSGYQLMSNELEIVKLDGSKTKVEFEYENNLTFVTIKALLEDTDKSVPGYSEVTVPAQKNQPFSYNAPYIPGYIISTGSSIVGTIGKVDEKNNTLTFYYREFDQIPKDKESFVTVLLKEDNEDGRIIASSMDIIDFNEEKIIDIPDLSNDYYVSLSTSPQAIIGSGQDITIEYYYERLTRQVVVQLYDADNNKMIEEIDMGMYKVGETAVINAPYAQGYKLLSTSSNPLFTIVEEGKNKQIVIFEYVGAKEDEVIVNAVDEETDTIIYSYTVKGKIGERKVINAPNIYGYGLSSGQELSKETMTPGVVEFYYNKNYVTIKLKLVDENNKLIETPEWIQLEVKIARGTDYTIYAPHIDGYQIVSNQSTYIEKADENKEVTFVYKIKSEDKKPAIVTIQYIKSEDKTTILKEQTIDGLYTGNKFDVTKFVPTDFNQGGRKYKLDSTIDIKEIILEETNLVKVYYIDNGSETIGGGGGDTQPSEAKLIIQCVDANSGKIIYEQELTAIVGKEVKVTAPSIDGYKLDDRSKESQTIKIKVKDNIAVFMYNKDDSENVTNRVYVSDKIKNILETEDHIQYIKGYEDVTVRPNNSITRAETAQIFFRLLKDKNKNNEVEKNFDDVNDSEWYAQAINYLSKIDIIRGYEDNTFKPNQSITRAEFAVIASRFDNLDIDVNNIFTDVNSTHWAYDYILSAYVKGWISGYPGGQFQPDNKITRSEVVTIVNKMLGRNSNIDTIPNSIYNTYKDLNTSHWAFVDMMEASTEHTYNWNKEGYEVWTHWNKSE